MRDRVYSLFIPLLLLVIVLSPYTVLAYRPPILHDINKYLLPSDWYMVDSDHDFMVIILKT